MILSIAPQKFGGLFPILSCTYRSRVIGLQLTTLYMGNGWVTPKTCLCAAENNRNLRISRKIPLFSGAMSCYCSGRTVSPYTSRGLLSRWWSELPRNRWDMLPGSLEGKFFWWCLFFFWWDFYGICFPLHGKETATSPVSFFLVHGFFFW